MKLFSDTSLPATACWFLAGGAITAVFSASLAMQATNVGWMYVLAVGMIIPSFTWVVQFTASALFMAPARRPVYWADLGRICVAGSVALLPAGLANFIPGTPLWLSAANVLLSVLTMAVMLFILSARHHHSPRWPVSWCATITVNMGLFLWASHDWWPKA